jgi:hypothetical protein
MFCLMDVALAGLRRGVARKSMLVSSWAHVSREEKADPNIELGSTFFQQTSGP